MGRVRTKTVKRSARMIVERYYSKLALDFDLNKRVVDDVTEVPSKAMRNKIAGWVTHLMRRIERGDQVRGVSLKLQEEERERRMDYVPEKSALDVSNIVIDRETKDLLKKLGLGDIKAKVVERSNRGGKNFNRNNRAPRTQAAPAAAAASA